MKLTRTSPCHDCAFRRNSKPGWTGSYEPAEFAARVLDSDSEEPCHIAVDYDDPDWRDKLDDAPYCAGGLTFVRNNFKIPRDPERAAVVASVNPSDKVFRSPAAFLSHHLRRDVSHREAMELMAQARHDMASRDYPTDSDDNPERMEAAKQ